jgi:guanosine-3',5'-bis(diphosphate) 3'-pyrophosphohydrolase
MRRVAERCNLPTTEDLLAGLGFGALTLQQVLNRLREEIRLQTAVLEAPLTNEDVARQLVKQSEQKTPHREIPASGVEPILGVEGLDHRLGGCCSPLPGEAILGAVALGNHGITIHRQDCPNVESIPTERRLPVRWNPSLQETALRFPAQLRIEVIDRVGILKDILMRLSDGSINVSDARVRTAYGKPARIDLMVELGSSVQLQRTMDQIRSMADVIDIARTGQS